MPDAAPTETELKLQLAPTDINRLRLASALAESACTEVDLENVYFDTSDRLLQRHQMALRLRRIGKRWLQTLKSERKGGAVSQRHEWETPARVQRGQGQIDMARLAQSPLSDLLARKNRRMALHPIFRTHVRRSQWLIKRAGATIEVALDVGEIVVQQHDAARESICEVELELKQAQGDNGPAALIDLALELLDGNGRQPLRLTPVSRSKAERGYQFAAQRPPTADKASAKGFVEGLTPKITTSSALRAIVAHGLAVTTANVELLLRYDEPEYVHQARVALRRVRSAIRLFDRAQCETPKSWTDELRWFARALGDARDWDVICDETLPSMSNGIGVAAVKPLVAKADQQRRYARAKIRKAARSPRYAALVLNGERWCLTAPPEGSEILADAAAPALQKAAKRLFKSACFFTALSPSQQHRVRILAKRLRYALDLFAVGLPKEAAERYTDALAALQDALGQLNDAAVARRVLPQLSKALQLRRSARAWFASIEPDRLRDVEQRLLKLSTMQKPWQ